MKESLELWGGIEMSKGRVPLQVSPKFRDKLKEIQRKIIASGNDISLRDLTEEITTTNSLDHLEEKLMLKKIKDINLKLDKRGR
jgi:hypothetical protein